LNLLETSLGLLTQVNETESSLNNFRCIVTFQPRSATLISLKYNVLGENTKRFFQANESIVEVGKQWMKKRRQTASFSLRNLETCALCDNQWLLTLAIT